MQFTRTGRTAYSFGTLTMATLPKRFIDATKDPDPYQKAMEEAKKAVMQ